MRAEIRLSEGVTEHLSALEELERLCFSDPWSRRMLESQMGTEDGAFIVAENASGGIMGYAACRSVLDEGWLTNMAVSPAFRRRGVADALITGVARWARSKGLSFVTLEVRESNAPAIALYQKHGFQCVGMRRDYYENPRESALLMTLDL